VEVVILPAIQQLIDEFVVLFEVPIELPPSRTCDHSIPLVEGPAPVNVRPYRYTPALKTEIERQVQEMLDNGIIQKSNNPFSSSVILVKKKDHTWIFCVDYRHLNAITIKSKFHVPVIDEFLDELAHASWFTKLDLRVGFHQIRLKPEEEFKTAFQTHFGQFEFTVMAFGLTGAPGTFQGAMNSTLAPCLRKFVLLFFDDILIYSKTLTEHLVHIRLILSCWLKISGRSNYPNAPLLRDLSVIWGTSLVRKKLALIPRKLLLLPNGLHPRMLKSSEASLAWLVITGNLLGTLE
jgi:hypothetical protein